MGYENMLKEYERAKEGKSNLLEKEIKNITYLLDTGKDYVLHFKNSNTSENKHSWKKIKKAIERTLEISNEKLSTEYFSNLIKSYENIDKKSAKIYLSKHK